MKLETELKILISEPGALRRRLRAAGFQPGPRLREINWLLDNPSGDLARAGLLLRLRRRGGQWLLTAKGPRRPDARLKIRPEAQMALPEGRPLLAIFGLVQLSPRLIYERDRTIWLSPRWPQLEAAWDRTPIGGYLELEGPARAINRLTRQLAAPAAAISTASYPDLFRAWARRHGYRGQEFTFAALRGQARPRGRRRKPGGMTRGAREN